MSNAATYRIPTQFLAELEQKVAKINKKATKIGTDLVTVTRTGRTETVNLQSKAGRLSYEAEYVELVGHAPVINGWEFVAVIRHITGGNEFHVLPTVEGELELADYAYVAKNCDHCNQNRVRNATYLLRDGEGTLKQVGSTCLGDFTGYNDPHAAARACENIFKLFHTFEGYSRMVPRTTKTFFLAEWMAFVAQSLRIDGGWASRAQAGPESTCDRAKTRIIGFVKHDEDVEAPTPADWNKGEEVIAWVRDMEPGDNDFLQSVKAAMASDDSLTEQDMGRSAASFIAMWKAEAEAAKAVAQATQGYLGVKGDKITFEATLDRTGEYHGDYGKSWIYNFTATDGNKAVWFSTRDLGLENGDSYSVTGTVKKQDVDRRTGDKVTSVNRCKVVAL